MRKKRNHKNRLLCVEDSIASDKMARLSNIELLRIIAMLMILLLHANGALGPVSAEEVTSSPVTSFLRALCEQASIIGVNVFILISGWFGIRAKVKGLMNFFFQVAFCSIFIAIFFKLSGLEITGGLKDVLLACTGLPYWFVTAYIILFMLSPVLNAFAQTADKKTYMLFLLGFFIVQQIYGRFGDQGHFQAGYSAISFVGLYLLSGYVRRYPFKLTTFSAGVDFLIYAVIVFGATLYNYLTPGGVPYGGPHSTFDYNNIVVIVSSLYFFLGFTKMDFESKGVNWLAASAFSIYLIHMNFLVAPYYRELFVELFGRYPDFRFFLLSIPIVLVIGLGCILVDKIRIFLWQRLWNIYERSSIGKFIEQW